MVLPNHIAATESSGLAEQQINRWRRFAVKSNHHGEGLYTASVTLTEAGPFTVSIRHAGEDGRHIVFQNACVAGPLSVPHCAVISVDTCLTAGQTGQLKVQRRDK